MPLHLLHHKSYHVYSAENIARVRRDEAEAASRGAAEDARMQATDVEARMKLLRERATRGNSAVEGEPEHGTEEPTARSVGARDHRPRPPLEGGILGVDGHINLFPTPAVPRSGNPERDRERKEEKERGEGAMGRVVGERLPWYSSIDLVSGQQREKEQDGRKTEWEGKREGRRKEAGDPLGVIRRGVRGVKEAHRDREEWKRRRGMEVDGVGAGGWRGGQDERAQGNERADRGVRNGDRKRRSRSRSRSRSGGLGRHDTSRKRHSHSHPSSHSRSHRRRHDLDDLNRHDRHHDRHNSHSRHPRSHRCKSRSNTRSRFESPNPTLESLREEKLLRESTERRKAASLLAKAHADSEPGWKPAPGGRYSSQFGYQPG
ncbi:unnamed protein product [Tuber aestivum]|uniref:CBF1-interacting co-repressor CIR N-terminal domain-containing protein n=1 Tax=Tuber aestivum TaxID=59557 RepID=A0A292PNU2_9PEZI|nr:unnamed protein product [Tuber aestivum]